jgi:hypothetical protein
VLQWIVLRLAVVVIALSAAADADPRAGRVVRVERGPKRALGTPRWCEMNTGDLSGFCVGKQPAIGERITLVGDRKVLGVAAVIATSPYMSSCNDSTLWQVQSRLELGDLAGQAGLEVGVIDVAVDLRAGKLVSVDATRTPLGAGVVVDTVKAIDTDGDGVPDVELVVYYCDDNGTPTQAQDAKCVDVWMAYGKRKFERARQDRVRNC